MKKILIATEKPFAPAAVEQIRAIFQSGDYQVSMLEKYSSADELYSAIADADAVIIRSDQITATVMDHAPKLKIVVRAGAGYDNVDLEAASLKDITVMNTPGQNSNAVAELALGMMIFQARGQFSGKAGTELRDKTLGIHAYGNVGRYVAIIAKGFGMKVKAFDPYVSAEAIMADGVEAVGSVQELYRSCQYVSLHIPANAQTKGSIGAALLSTMPEGACLVNTARKEVIDEAGMLAVMESRSDFCYLSDIAPDCAGTFNEKYTGRFFFTPKKMGAQTAEANINAGLAAARQIVNFFEKGDTTYKVN